MVSLRKTSLVDYPGRVSAVIFLPGCNLRCPWCQNRGLVLQTAPAPGEQGLVPLEEALALIEKRRKLLGGVVVSGGEPTIYPALGDLMTGLHDLGLPVKLDTNGMNPRTLEKICGDRSSRPDYIALDLKLAPRRYGDLLPRGEAGPPPFDPAAALAESAALIRSSGIPHEYRSLALPEGYFGRGDIEALSPLVAGGPWHFRPFSPGNCLDPAWDSLPSTGEKETAALAETAKQGGRLD
ncbi:MAG: anaerobic ribonucleoside-triphosphate reductase activating protein [Treponema sp.]|jgi:pyruvate formate lyase activating enzyme|nr:anaerobic ribonucleoside-triphosphate reductase activating protein [Treponema sp.]